MKLKISFYTFLFAISLIISFDTSVAVILSAAAIHELGHLIMAKLRGVRILALELDVIGARMELERSTLSYLDEILIASGGPLINLICAFGTVALVPYNDFQHGVIFLSASLSLAIINLMPIISFDGGRITHCLLLIFLDIRAADTVLLFLSFCVLFALWSISVYLLLRIGMSLSLFIFSLSLFCKIFVDKKGT